MAVRTTELAVGGIVEVDVDISLTPFIEAANALIDKIVEPALDDDTQEELVERWLSAHFYALRDQVQNLQQVGLGRGAVAPKFHGRTETSLDYTRYGQMAKSLDTSGALASWDDAVKKGKARFATAGWLGTTTDKNTGEKV